jgi:hypothetical protein
LNIYSFSALAGRFRGKKPPIPLMWVILLILTDLTISAQRVAPI